MRTHFAYVLNQLISNVIMTMLISQIRKYAVLCAVVIVVGFSAQSASAQSTAALQQQINQLLAQIAVLQAQLGGITGTCSATFTQSMGIGASGPQVLALQKFLNRDADTRLAVSGAGSPGLETQYYGPITANAVSRFQAKYRSDILTPLGLVTPTGFFGASSIAKANALCTVTVPPPADDDDDEDDNRDLEGGEAVLRDFEASDGADTSLNEGQTNAPVMDVEFEVAEGDIEINRIDVAVDHISGGDDDPWDVFESISIWVDGNRVAEMDVDRRSVWSSNTPNSGDYRVRLTGINEIVREGDRAEFTVAFSVANRVDDAGSVEWETFIPDNGIRAMDSLGLAHYIGDTDETVSFDINEQGGDDELMVRTSASDPRASTLQLRENRVSDWLTVFAFMLDADDSPNDIEIESIPVLVEFSNSLTYNTLVNDARLVVNGEEFDDFQVQNGNTDEATLVFDLDRDLVIDAGEDVDVQLQLEFRALASANQGTTVRASISSTLAEQIEAEGADDLDADQIGGSATGKTHVLRSSGTSIGDSNTSATVTTVNGSNNDYATFEVEMDITAFEQDAYIPTDESIATQWRIENANGTDITNTGTATAIWDSNADEEGNFYVVREGETETFTLRVTYVPGVSNTAARLQLLSVSYDSDPDLTPDQTWNAQPASEYRTPTRIIVD